MNSSNCSLPLLRKGISSLYSEVVLLLLSPCVTERILEFVLWKTETVFKAQVMANYMNRKCWGKAYFPRFRIIPSPPSKDCGYVCYWFPFSYCRWFCRLFPGVLYFALFWYSKNRSLKLLSLFLSIIPMVKVMFSWLREAIGPLWPWVSRP